MPEGDTLRRAAVRLRELAGERVEIEAVHPRARATAVAERLDGRRLERVDVVGKNLLLRFEGGYVLRSHLGMSGSWRLSPRGETVRGRPWLVLRGETKQAVLRGGSVLELSDRATKRLGPDILADPPEVEEMVENLRRCHPSVALGEALLDQRVVAGIGNLWRAEALWLAGLSPWLQLRHASDVELRLVLREAARVMRGSVEGRRRARNVYRRAGRPCTRCGETILARGQGIDNRVAYWCPGCQRGSSHLVR